MTNERKPDEGKPEDPRERLSGGLPRIVVFASGEGTNFQEVINAVEKGEIDAEITGLISNNPDAYAVKRASNHGIYSTIIPSYGRLKDPIKRREMERDIFNKVIDLSPDLIVLAGWMVVLSDNFIENANIMGIKIINLHPALLTEREEGEYDSSAGKIPVIRGAHAIQESYEMNLPFSGVTVHEVIPGPFDTGPIILQQEVVREAGDTPESWEQKIHEAEYSVLPKAINLVIHSMFR